MLSPWITREDALHGHNSTKKEAMLPKRDNCIFRTCGGISAGIWQPRRQENLIAFNQHHNQKRDGQKNQLGYSLETGPHEEFTIFCKANVKISESSPNSQSLEERKTKAIPILC